MATQNETSAPTLSDDLLLHRVPPLPPPEVLPFLPHDDRGPVIVGSVWLMIGVASIFLGLRLFGKYVGRRQLWWDDWVLIASWFVLAVDGALATYLVAYFGFGKHSWDIMPPSMNDFVLCINIRATFTITAISWTKSAFAITLLRLSRGWMTWLLWVILISMNVFNMLAALLRWVYCTPLAKSWTLSLPGTCWHPDVLMNVDISSSAYSAAMDFILAILPWKLLWSLQMKSHEKIGVAVCMSIGVLAGITAIVKTAMLHKPATGDIYDSADLLLWDIAEACVTMVAICIPILRTMFIELDVFGLRLGRKGTNITDQSVSKNGVLTIASKRTLKSTTSDTWHEDV